MKCTHLIINRLDIETLNYRHWYWIAWLDNGRRGKESMKPKQHAHLHIILREKKKKQKRTNRTEPNQIQIDEYECVHTILCVSVFVRCFECLRNSIAGLRSIAMVLLCMEQRAYTLQSVSLDKLHCNISDIVLFKI